MDFEIFKEIKDCLPEIFNKFSKTSILVLGDVMLDVYLLGDTERISPEAPVPVVNIKSSFERGGGAANTAINIKSMGEGYVHIVSVAGRDDNAKKIKKMLSSSSVDYTLIEDRTRPTTTKTRIISRSQQIVRIDFESSEKISDDILDDVIKSIKKLFREKRFDVVVFSDYNKGFFRKEIVKEVLKNGDIVVCDPKVANAEIFKGVFLVSPNLKEAKEIAGEKENNTKKIAEKIMKKYGVKNVLITKGEEGMDFFSRNTFFHMPALARSVYDVTGAGDTVTAMMALSVAASIDLKFGVALSSIAASIKVQNLGSYAVKKEEIEMALSQK